VAAAATALQPERAGATQGAVLPAGLSRREAEVALWVARGLTDKEVAAKLFLSRRTVDTHLRHIFGKVGIGNRAALGTWVAEQGLHRYLNE
jgi:DNA-binding CsgD family transcriptional regulator